jgi:hypothetical protein
MKKTPAKKAAPAGYSGKPLAAKLGLKPGARVAFLKIPDDVRATLEPFPEGSRVAGSLRGEADFVHAFVTTRADLSAQLAKIREKLAPDGMAWISWPKRSSGVATDVTEDVIRACALPLGLVDVKVCAVTDVWSGLKLVVRRELR